MVMLNMEMFFFLVMLCCCVSYLQKPGLPHGKPESSCVLQGASLEWAPSASTKKKNAFQVLSVKLTLSTLHMCAFWKSGVD